MGYVTQAYHGVPIDALVQVLEYIKRDADACKNEVVQFRERRNQQVVGLRNCLCMDI